MRRLAVLQWVGFFVAPAAWVAQHAIGQAAAQISCSVANQSWGVSNRAWQVGLMIGACVLIAGSWLAAFAVYRGTSEADYQSPPPTGRLQLFAIAGMVANLILFVIVVLDGIASIADVQCRQG